MRLTNLRMTALMLITAYGIHTFLSITTRACRCRDGTQLWRLDHDTQWWAAPDSAKGLPDLWASVDISKVPSGPTNAGHKPNASLARRLNVENVLTESQGDETVNLYYKGFPSKQAAVDLFQDMAGNHWFSAWPTLPGRLPVLSSVGDAMLYNDHRMQWFNKVMGGDIRGKTVYESGPLECHHSFFLHTLGVARVDAVEGNVGSYVKCLITKEVLNVKSLNVFLGDFVTFVRDTAKDPAKTKEEGLLTRYDIALFNGVLYHMDDPARTIAYISGISDVVVCWTQYWNEKNPHMLQSGIGYKNGKADVSEVVTIDDVQGLPPFTTTYHKHFYELTNKAHMGGQEPYANWQTNEEQFRTLKWAGYKYYIVQDDLDPCAHPHGCQHNFVASKVPQKDGTDFKWLPFS